MNADKLLVLNRRLSAFIGGWVISSVFQRPARKSRYPRPSVSIRGSK
jgi:hypothetical protein